MPLSGAGMNTPIVFPMQGGGGGGGNANLQPHQPQWNLFK